MSITSQTKGELSQPIKNPWQPFPRAKTPNKYLRFNLWLILGVILPMIGVGTINIIINPYDIYTIPKISGFNEVKPALWRNTRLFKAVQITRIEPTALYLGSSRVDYGLDPNHPIFQDVQPAYNLGLGATTPTEMLLYLKHTLANQPNLKKVVIGLDEFMFNELNYSPPEGQYRLGKKGLTIKDILETTISLKALEESHNTFQFSQKYLDYQTYNNQGQLNLRPTDKRPETIFFRFKIDMAIYFREFPEYPISNRALQDLTEIIRICEENKIEYKVFFSPSHATRWQMVNISGHWDEFEQVKREILKITPFWDFSGFNSITVEPISEDMKNYIDDSHYTKEIGNFVLNRMFNIETETIPDDFGVYLTPDNIEEHLEKIRQDKTKWIEENPRDVAFVEEIKASVND